MPDPIQPVPGLCTSVQTLDNYRRQINLSLQLTLDAINEELGTTFSLPGLPPLPVQGLPELVVPGRAGWDRDLQIRKPVPPAGFIGNRFGIRAGGKSVEAKLRIGELPGFSIGGTGGLVVGGTDPSTFLITWINTNYQILAEQLAGESIEWTPIQVPYTELCESGAGEQDGGGSVSPGQLLVNDIILLNNQNAENAAATGLCLRAFHPFGDGAGELNFDDGWWEESFGAGFDVVYGLTSLDITQLGAGSGNVYNFKTPGPTPLATEYNLDWQPLSCGRSGWKVITDYTVTNVSTTIAQLELYVYAVHDDSTDTQVQVLSANNIVPGTTASGTFTFTADPADFAATDTIGIRIRAVTGVFGGDATFTITNFRLEP
jgi:hypothetical protein